MADHGAEEVPTGLPEYDASSVSKVAKRVEIVNVELVGSHYERLDDGTELTPLPRELIPEFRIGVEWEQDGALLVVIATFATSFDDEEEQPYSIVGRFRLTYELEDGEPLESSDFNQFAHWNGMFNAWPYWREFVSSTVNRGQLPRFLVPVLGIPSARSTASDAS